MVAALLTAAVIGCGTHSSGPTALRSSDSGAVCMLAAFRNHCAPATYTLAVMGVDTIDRRSFRIANCRVYVSETFRVVPRPAQPTAHGTCGGLRRAGPDIVATGCVGTKLARTISLTH